jgi:peptidoglycan/LPS O-acetylase OafA/YrhL
MSIAFPGRSPLRERIQIGLRGRFGGGEQRRARAESRVAGASRRRDIQGLRAVAVVLVVVFHAGLPVPGGFTGVDVFFAISGFVITGTLLSELTAADSIGLPRFYARRIRRLLPALAVMLTVVALLATIASPAQTQRVGALTGAAASLFAANAYVFSLHDSYFHVISSWNFLLHTWTLAVEEQFYLVFPALLLVSWRLGRRVSSGAQRAAGFGAIAALSIVSFWLSLRLSAGRSMGGLPHTPDSARGFAFYGSPARAWEFGAGASLALAAPWLARLPRVPAGALGGIGIAGISVGAFAIHDTSSFPGTAALLPVGGACALLAAGTASGGVASRLVSARPAVWIGDLSYSWYLWHWPLIVFATALWSGQGAAPATAAALSLVPAWLSYRYVENPIRFNPRLRGRAVVALASVCIAVPLVASAGLLATDRALSGTSAMSRWNHSKRLHADVARGCDSETPLDERVGTACTWRVPSPRGQVVLLGDSNADHFVEPFVRATNSARLDATVATLAGCPFVDLRVVDAAVGTLVCRRFYIGAIRALVALSPSLVIVSARSTDYVESEEVGLGDPRSGAVTDRPGAKALLWQQGLVSAFDRLNRAGVRVVLLHPVPVLPLPEGCAIVRILAGSCIEASLARSVVDRERRRTVRAEARAVAQTPTTSAVDFENELCGRRVCSTVRGSTILYSDSSHLSVDGALTLTDLFGRVIAANASPRAGKAVAPR